MQFFDRPGAGRAPISLRGNSSRAASSSDILAASARARQKRAEQRARHAAATLAQSAARRRLAASAVAASAPAGCPLALLMAAGAVARAPALDDALQANPLAGRLGGQIAAPDARAELLGAPASVRRKMLPVLAALSASQTDARRGMLEAVEALAGSLRGDGGTAAVLVLAGWGFFGSIAPSVQAAVGASDDAALSQLRRLVDAVFAAAPPDALGSPALDAQFVQTVLVVPGAAKHLQLRARPALVSRLLAAVSASTDLIGSSENADEDAPVVLENVLDLAGDVWTGGRARSLWPAVSATSALVGLLARAGDLKDRMEDEAEEEGGLGSADASGPLGRLVHSLSTVVSESVVRSLFNAAVAEGRHAAVSVCNLFNLLVRCDAHLKMGFQNALAFWRRAEGEVIGHILPRLWSMCYEAPMPPPPTARNPNPPARLPGSGAVVADDCGPVLLVFARAYAHLLYVQDEDEMFESRRPFSPDEIREISLVLKNTLYVALYVPNRVVFGPPVVNILRADPDLFDEVSRLLSRLYIWDSRRKFRTSDNFWLAGNGSLARDDFVKDAVEAGPGALVRSRRLSIYGGMRQISYASRQNHVNGAGELLRVAPYLAPFSSRAKIFHKWVAEERMKFNGGALFGGMGGRRLEVRRKYLFEDAFKELSGLQEQLKTTVRVKFIDEHGLEEAGIDGGGVFKEFMNEVLRQGFSPESYGLFKKTSDGLLYPNPDIETINENYETQFKFLGSLLGKALFDAVLVNIPFASFFLSKMLGNLNYPNDLNSLDPELYRNLKYLKNCDASTVEDLGLNFTIVNNAYGAVNEVELITNGRNTPVTAANRIEYIHRVSNYRMNKQLRKQTEAFLTGFSEVVRPEFIRLFSERELQHLISGAVGRIDIRDWRMHTKYSSGYDENSDVIKWFWEVVMEVSAEEQGRLLQFVTSSPRAPLLGFSYLNPCFTIQRAEGDVRLPTASTCLNLLKLPNYPSLEVVREKLKYALTSNTGFNLS